ncbi:unnamed protein product [Ectocarpus sp. 12 AP-2014]
MENRNITCSYFGVYGTPFHAEVLIDYDDGETLNGCYDHSGYLTLHNKLPIFTVGGVYEYGQPAFFAQFDSSLNEYHGYSFSSNQFGICFTKDVDACSSSDACASNTASTTNYACTRNALYASTNKAFDAFSSSALDVRSSCCGNFGNYITILGRKRGSASGYHLWWRGRGSLRGCCRCSRSSAQDWSHLNLGARMITQVRRGWSWLGVRTNPCLVSRDLSGSLFKNGCMWFACCSPFVWYSRPTRHGPVEAAESTRLSARSTGVSAKQSALFPGSVIVSIVGDSFSPVSPIHRLVFSFPVPRPTP